MPEHYADEYTMTLIAPVSPNPRVIGQWVNPAPVEPESVDEVETKVVAAPRKRVAKPRTKAESK